MTTTYEEFSDAFDQASKKAPRTAMQRLRTITKASISDIENLKDQAFCEDVAKGHAPNEVEAKVNVLGATAHIRCATFEMNMLGQSGRMFETMEDIDLAAQSILDQAKLGGLTRLFELDLAKSVRRAQRVVALRDERQFLWSSGDAKWTKETIDDKYARVASHLERAGIEITSEKKCGLLIAYKRICEGSAAKRIDKLSKTRSVEYDAQAIEVENGILLDLIPSTNEKLLASWNAAKHRLSKREEERHIPRKTKEKNKAATMRNTLQP